MTHVIRLRPSSRNRHSRRPRPALIVPILEIAVLLSLFPAGKATAEWYAVGNYYNQQLATTWNVESATPPVQWQIDNEFWQSTIMRSRRAYAGRGELAEYYWSYNTGQYSVGPDQFPLAKMRFEDLVFSCSDGAPSATVRLNLQIDAYYTFDPSPANATGSQGGSIQFQVVFNPGGGVNIGYWAPSSSESPTSSTGIFVGQTGDAIHGVFTTPAVTVPTNTPVTLEVTMMTRPNNCCYGAAHVNGIAHLEFANRGVGPVFQFLNVPQGVTCTVNSAEALISNNVFDPPIPVAQRTWGALKDLYR